MAKLDFHGMDLINPINRIPGGRVSFAQNVRAYIKGGFISRNLLTAPVATPLLPNALHSIKRLNDSTPNGPTSGYTLINGAGTTLYAGSTSVATGMSSNPVSEIPFRPNTSVQPWMYVGDPSENVIISTKSLYSGNAISFPCFGMVKVRSDGRIYKMGIKEPQIEPEVSTESSQVPTTGKLYATAIPWTNYPVGTNPNDDYGETEGYPNTTPPVDGTAPYSIDVLNASTVTISILMVAGVTVTINGSTITTPADTTHSPALASTNPGYYVQPTGGDYPPSTKPSIIIGAFTDGDGNVIDAGVAPLWVKNIVDVGGTLTIAITVPSGAVSFQIGINSTGNTFSNNSGYFNITAIVQTNALPSVTATLGDLTCYYWDDSPHSGAVARYIWKNPDDTGGSGPVRTISNAVGSTTGNSFIFDASFGSSASPAQPAGIPGLPGIGTKDLAMEWTILNSESVATGTLPVFASPLTTTDTTNTKYQNFNFCLVGSIYFPAAGYYTFVMTNHDDVIWGIRGVTLVSATGTNTTELSSAGQTITVVDGIPLLPTTKYTSGEDGFYVKTTVVIHVASAGTHAIELDYDYWYHSGRILLLMSSPTASTSTTPNAVPVTIVPPITANVRQEVQYRYIYRSSATGAMSNPSPESTAESIPVTSNTITSFWSNDPQVDKVDYYRVDANVSDFTYVCTGPNDDVDPVAGTNTAVTDALTDTELGSTLLESDNFEPFPSIDLPQKGICEVSGGVITWDSGGAIGGTAIGFNTRWLAGTKILIGWPTSLEYTMVARPTAKAFETLKAYPLNWVIKDINNHYQLVTVAGTSGSTTPTFSSSGGTTTSGNVTFTDRGIVVPPGFVETITIPGVPDGTSQTYEISEPILAAQPLAYMWGPTDNVNYAFAVGDSLRPGTLYWCKGSNLDSAPDTNQLDVTDPSEPLVNGAISNGRGVLFSIKRSWIITQNYSATSTSTGTTGLIWNVQETSINRGLFIPRCLAVEGGGNIFFRVDDGINVSPGGLNSKSITDDVLYSIFSHEGSVPTTIVRNGVTIYPPDDSQPQLQKFSIQNGYLYYDYVDTTNVPRTLVFDIAAMGWIWDVYQWPATIHAADEGSDTQGTLVGCNDGSIRLMSSAGTETGTYLVLTPAIGGTGWMHLRDITVEYISSAPITLECLAADADNGSYGPPTITIPSSAGSLTKLNIENGPGANKWKLMWFQFSSTNPFEINMEGFAVKVKPWGSTAAYQTVLPFAGPGGEG